MTEAKKGKQPTIKVIPPKTIVRKLAVGEEVTGRVRRLADFGAFIDIGVGTDGLAHVSELTLARINKPSDFLRVGQEVQAWIKELDKDRNRISLTLIRPGTRTIDDLIAGEVVSGVVTRVENYGIFVDIGVGYDARVHVKEMTHGFLKHPGDMVSLGDTIEAEVLEVRPRRGQIDLSMRALQPEPQAQPEPESHAPARAAAPAEIEDEVIPEEEEPAPTLFEMALLAAEENRRRKDRKRRKSQWYEQEDETDDLIQRTLSLSDRG